MDHAATTASTGDAAPRHTMHHLRDFIPRASIPLAEAAGSGGLFALAKRLAESGLTWESAAAIIGAVGTLLLGLGSVLRELRAMKAAKA